MTTPRVSSATPNEIDRIYADAGLIDAAEVDAKRPNRRGEQTRERIIEAAIACFTEYGYTRTRISDITHRAGTAQGNFYRHFSSLDQVFLAAIRPSLDALTGSLSGRSRSDGNLKALTDVTVAYLTTYAQHRHVLRLLREAAAASANDGFLTLWLRIRSDFVARTRRWLQRLEDNATIVAGTDLDLLAEGLGSLTEQMAYIHVGLPAATPRRERLEEIGRSIAQIWHRSLPRAELDHIS